MKSKYKRVVFHGNRMVKEWRRRPGVGLGYLWAMGGVQWRSREDEEFLKWREDGFMGNGEGGQWELGNEEGARWW